MAISDTILSIGTMFTCIQFLFPIFGIFLLYFGISSYLGARKIENTPTSKIRSVALGLVEIFGKARPKKKMLSLISKKPCAYWRVAISYLKGSGKRAKYIYFFEKSSDRQFYLEDDTGRILIDAEDEDIDTEDGFEFEGAGKMPQEVLQFLEAYPEAKKKIEELKGEEISIEEYFLKDGKEVYILGTVEPIDGSTSEIHTENLVIRRGISDKEFIMSGSSERDTVGRSKLIAFAMIVIGLFVIAIGLFYAFFAQVFVSLLAKSL